MEILLFLIVEDGNLNRDHRKTILSDKFKYIGIAS